MAPLILLLENFHRFMLVDGTGSGAVVFENKGNERLTNYQTDVQRQTGIFSHRPAGAF